MFHLMWYLLLHHIQWNLEHMLDMQHVGMFTFNLSFIYIPPYYNKTVTHFYLNLIEKQDDGEEKVNI